MATCRFDITQGACALELDLVGTQSANGTRGHPHSEQARFDLRPRGDDRTRSHQGILPDLGTVENDRADPDECAVGNATSMHDGAMPDCDFISQKRREATCRDMQRGLVLDVGAFADANSFDVASQDGSVENARVGTDLDVADDGCAGRDPDAVMQTRICVPETANDRAGPKIRHSIRSPPLRNRPRHCRRSEGFRRESSGYNALRSRRSP